MLAGINASTEQKLGDYATNTQLAATNAQVAQKLNTSDLAISITQLPTAVQLAWNGISNYIQFEQGALDIYDSNVTSTQKLVTRFYKDGIAFWRDDSFLGQMGTSTYSSSTKGLQLGLNSSGYFTSFGVYNGSSYEAWLSVNKANGLYTNAGVNLGADLYCNNNKLHDCFVENLQVTYNNSNYYGYTGTIPIINSITDNGDGTISWQYSQLRVSNGIIVGYWN